jgi:hypothetical protein
MELVLASADPRHRYDDPVNWLGKELLRSPRVRTRGQFEAENRSQRNDARLLVGGPPCTRKAAVVEGLRELQFGAQRCSVAPPRRRRNPDVQREEHRVTYGVVHQFAGGTEKQYQASVAAVHPSDGSLPEGQVFHLAGPSADGWVIVAIHDSQQSWEKFRDGTLMPRMQAGIDGGFAAPPQETSFEVHNQVSA